MSETKSRMEEEKRMRQISIVIISFTVLFLCGCAGITYPEVSQLSGNIYAPLPANTPVQLTSFGVDKINKECEEIAVISVRSAAWTKIDLLNEALRKKARNVGANMVVNIQYGHEGMWGNPTATGIAVRVK